MEHLFELYRRWQDGRETYSMDLPIERCEYCMEKFVKDDRVVCTRNPITQKVAIVHAYHVEG